MPSKTKSGSETRQRRKTVTVRLTDMEFMSLESAAGRSGLTLADYARSSMLSIEPIGRSRPIKIDRDGLRRLLGHLGKIGSNINQMAHQMNSAKGAWSPEKDVLNRAYEQLVAMRSLTADVLFQRAPSNDH